MKENIINLVNTLNAIIPHYNFYLFDDNIIIEDFVNTLNKQHSSDNCIIIYSNSSVNIQQNQKLNFLLKHKIKLISITHLNNHTKIGPFIKNIHSLPPIQPFNELSNYKKELIDCNYSNTDFINVLCNLIMLLINSTTNTNNIFVIHHSKNNIEIEKYTPNEQNTPLESF